MCERNKPVARIVPCQLQDYVELEKRLIERGVLTPPRRRKRAPLPKPAGNIPDGVLDRVWDAEREGR